MAKIIAARSAQTVLEAEFTFKFDDTMVNTAGNEVDFGKVNLGAAAGSFDIIPLPLGATIVGGEVVTETAFDTASFALVVGDKTVANRFLASTDVKAAARVPLVPTGYVGNSEGIRIGFTSADVCTTGKATVRILYTVKNRVSEIQVG